MSDRGNCQNRTGIFQRNQTHQDFLGKKIKTVRNQSLIGYITLGLQSNHQKLKPL